MNSTIIQGAIQRSVSNKIVKTARKTQNEVVIFDFFIMWFRGKSLLQNHFKIKSNAIEANARPAFLFGLFQKFSFLMPQRYNTYAVHFRYRILSFLILFSYVLPKT